jgi:hypothetical protein
MTQRSFRAPALALALCFASLALGADAGYTELFNGKDLTGWRQAPGVALDGRTETPERRFVVSGGVITSPAKDKDGKRGTVDLWINREIPKEFSLKLEYRAAQEAVAYLVLRNHALPLGDFIRRGEQTHLKQFRNDDWNQVDLTVKMGASAGGRYLTDTERLEISFSKGKATARLNGQVIDPNPSAIQLLGHLKCNGETLYGHSFGVLSKGDIGLRAYSGKVEFRNIRYRPLP